MNIKAIHLLPCKSIFGQRKLDQKYEFCCSISTSTMTNYKALLRLHLVAFLLVSAGLALPNLEKNVLNILFTFESIIVKSQFSLSLDLV